MFWQDGCHGTLTQVISTIFRPIFSYFHNFTPKIAWKILFKVFKDQDLIINLKKVANKNVVCGWTSLTQIGINIVF